MYDNTNNYMYTCNYYYHEYENQLHVCVKYLLLIHFASEPSFLFKMAE